MTLMHKSDNMALYYGAALLHYLSQQTSDCSLESSVYITLIDVMYFQSYVIVIKVNA